MKNAIIGFAFNYSNEDIAPFLNSLNRTGFKGDLILYINNKSSIAGGNYGYNLILNNFEKDHKYSILKQKILKTVLHFFYKYVRNNHSIKSLKIVKGSNTFSTNMLSYFYVNYYLATIRFILYYNFLLRNRYDNVFFSDVSDVFFQDDIFKYAVPNKIMAFEEKKEVLLEQDEFNKNWVIECCGEKAFLTMSKKNIYCSGTILGDYDTSIKFLKDYIKLIMSSEFKRSIVGLDQGFYNYMISYQQMDYFKKSEDGEIIFTVALRSLQDFLIKGDKVYYTEKPDTIPSVVHQYTRHPQILSFIKKIYSSN